MKIFNSGSLQLLALDTNASVADFGRWLSQVGLDLLWYSPTHDISNNHPHCLHCYFLMKWAEESEPLPQLQIELFEPGTFNFGDYIFISYFSRLMAIGLLSSFILFLIVCAQSQYFAFWLIQNGFCFSWLVLAILYWFFEKFTMCFLFFYLGNLLPTGLVNYSHHFYNISVHFPFFCCFTSHFH